MMGEQKQSQLPSVAVIVPAYNEEDYIEKTLRAVKESNYPRQLLEVIVVDNASSDDTVDIAKKFADKVLSLENGNVGAVRNYGANHSQAEIFIFLDADCLIDKEWLGRGVSLVRKNPGCAYGGPYKTRRNARWLEKSWLLENPSHPRLQPDLLGGCIFISSIVFRELSGFNEDMTSGEDSELSSRLRKKGYSVNIKESLSVIHLGNPQRLRDFFTRQIWHSENYLLFLKDSLKDYTFWLICIFICSIISAIYGVIARDIKTIAIAFIAASIIALALTAKRLLLTKYAPKGAVEFIQIYFLDLTYLLARSIGLLKPLFRRRK